MNKDYILYQVIVCEFGCLNPQQHIQAMNTYYEMHGGFPNGSLEATMRYWMKHYLELNANNQAQLSLEERTQLKEFLTLFPVETVACRFCDLLAGVILTQTAIRFLINGTEQKLYQIDNWLAAHCNREQAHSFLNKRELLYTATDIAPT